MTWPPATHQDVQDDLTDGHGWAASLSERFGLGEQLTATQLLWVVGNYYTSNLGTGALNNASVTANRMILTPIYFPVSRPVDQIAVNVSSAGTASHVARLGIYNASASSGLPTTVRVDAGTVLVDSAGAKTATISTSLAGLFWLAVSAQSGTLSGHATASVAAIGGVSSVSAAAAGCLQRNSTLPTSALPDLTGDGTLTLNISTPPRVLLRAA